MKGFKEFIAKGNVMDMAVGVIIGGAFGKIVTSLVNDVLMPAIGILVGKVNFNELKYVITPGDEAAEIAEVAIYYGKFIQSIVDFLIIALCIYWMVNAVMKLKKKEEEAPAEEAAEEPSEDIVLLTEIRDLLKK